MLSCGLRNPKFNENRVLMYCFGLISFTPDFFPSPSDFKEGRKKEGNKRIKTKASLTDEGLYLVLQTK